MDAMYLNYEQARHLQVLRPLEKGSDAPELNEATQLSQSLQGFLNLAVAKGLYGECIYMFE